MQKKHLTPSSDDADLQKIEELVKFLGFIEETLYKDKSIEIFRNKLLSYLYQSDNFQKNNRYIVDYIKILIDKNRIPEDLKSIAQWIRDDLEIKDSKKLEAKELKIGTKLKKIIENVENHDLLRQMIDTTIHEVAGKQQQPIPRFIRMQSSEVLPQTHPKQTREEQLAEDAYQHMIRSDPDIKLESEPGEGFLAAIGCYREILEIAKKKPETKAEAETDKSQNLSKEPAISDKKLMEYRRHLAFAQFKYAEVCTKLQKWQDCIGYFEDAINTVLKLPNLEEMDHRNLATFYLKMAKAQLENNQLEDAIESLTQYEKQLESAQVKLASQSIQSPQINEVLVRMQRETIPVFEKLILKLIQNPNEDNLKRFVIYQNKMIETLLFVEQRSQNEYDLVVTINLHDGLIQFIANLPENFYYENESLPEFLNKEKYYLANLHHRLVDIYTQMGRINEAGQHLMYAIKLMDELIETVQDNPDASWEAYDEYKEIIAKYTLELAQLYYQINKYQEAKKYFQKSLDIIDELSSEYETDFPREQTLKILASIESVLTPNRMFTGELQGDVKNETVFEHKDNPVTGKLTHLIDQLEKNKDEIIKSIKSTKAENITSLCEKVTMFTQALQERLTVCQNQTDFSDKTIIDTLNRLSALSYQSAHSQVSHAIKPIFALVEKEILSDRDLFCFFIPNEDALAFAKQKQVFSSENNLDALYAQHNKVEPVKDQSQNPESPGGLSA